MGEKITRKVLKTKVTGDTRTEDLNKILEEDLKRQDDELQNTLANLFKEEKPTPTTSSQETVSPKN